MAAGPCHKEGNQPAVFSGVGRPGPEFREKDIEISDLAEQAAHPCQLGTEQAAAAAAEDGRKQPKRDTQAAGGDAQVVEGFRVRVFQDSRDIDPDLQNLARDDLARGTGERIVGPEPSGGQARDALGATPRRGLRSSAFSVVGGFRRDAGRERQEQCLDATQVLHASLLRFHLERLNCGAHL